MTTIRCALCLHVKRLLAPEADAIVSGTSVCYEHMGYFQSGATLSQAIAVWNEQHPGGGQ
jgi:hypothetical protein